MEFHEGIYDQVLTDVVFAALSQATSDDTRKVIPLQPDDAPARLADALAQQLVRILDDLAGSGQEKLQRQLDLVNAILVTT
ncbi:MAG: hypothetical protein WBV56_11745, partial [Azonexus sp.]